MVRGERTHMLQYWIENYHFLEESILRLAAFIRLSWYLKIVKKIYFMYMVSETAKTERELIKITSIIREKMDTSHYSIETEKLDLNKNHNYSSATICYLEFNNTNLPNNDILKEEILELLDLHLKYKNVYI